MLEAMREGVKVRRASSDEAVTLAALHVTTWQQAYEGLLLSSRGRARC